MISKERLQALYKDVICKAYCPIETPSRVIELVRDNPDMTQTDALRTVIRDQAIRSFELGVLQCSRSELQELLDDLKLGRRRSVNLCKLKSQLDWDMGMRKRPQHQVRIGYTTPLDLLVLETARNEAARRKIPLVRFFKKAIVEYLVSEKLLTPEQLVEADRGESQ